MANRPIPRLAHRAGPVEVEIDPDGEEISVQRCLRCDRALMYEGEAHFPAPLGSRFPLLGEERCAGALVEPAL
jgi:hypothetical protein